MEHRQFQPTQFFPMTYTRHIIHVQIYEKKVQSEKVSRRGKPTKLPSVHLYENKIDPVFFDPQMNGVVLFVVRRQK